MSDSNETMKIVASMLSRAKQYGLEVEVVADFGYARSTGDTVAEAASYALSEWDL
jgi:hypothetical protein